MGTNEGFECNTPDVVFENFGDEVILLHLKSGKYYSLNAPGMVLWELLSQGVTAEETARHVTAFYTARSGQAAAGPPIRADVDRLLGEFVSEKLLRPGAVSQAASAVKIESTLPSVYESAEMTMFDDVAELLMLDPVHEVADAGWPLPAPTAPAHEAN